MRLAGTRDCHVDPREKAGTAKIEDARLCEIEQRKKNAGRKLNIQLYIIISPKIIIE